MHSHIHDTTLGPRATRDGKVVSMNRFRSGRSLSPLRQAEAYWDLLRNGDDVPQRSRIDPRGLENILQHAFMLERVAPGLARFRLAGQHLAGLAGMDVRGMPLSALVVPAARGRLSAVLQSLFDVPSVAELALTAGPGREARMILLPLSDDIGAISRALGVLVADGPAGGDPLRFDIAEAQVRAVGARQFPPIAQHRDVPGLAETAIPYLRVVR